MKNLQTNVKLLCPVCGNDQFESLDISIDNLFDSEDSSRVQCIDCKRIFTKQELIEENNEVIEAGVKELAFEAKTQFEKELEKMLKKFK